MKLSLETQLNMYSLVVRNHCAFDASCLLVKVKWPLDRPRHPPMRFNAVTALFDNCRVAAAVFDCIGALYRQWHVQLPASTLRVCISAGGRRRRLHWRAIMLAACAIAIFGIADALRRWCVKY